MAPPNNGLSDQQLVLAWVKENIQVMYITGLNILLKIIPLPLHWKNNFPLMKKNHDNFFWMDLSDIVGK